VFFLLDRVDSMIVISFHDPSMSAHQPYKRDGTIPVYIPDTMTSGLVLPTRAHTTTNHARTVIPLDDTPVTERDSRFRVGGFTKKR